MNDPDPTSPPTPDRALSFFRDRFGLNDRSLATALDTALERQIDHADLYFEYTTTDSVSLEEGLVKSGDRHLEQGVGVRAIRGEKQGYAHSDDLSLDSAKIAAGTARAIATESGDRSPVSITARAPGHDLYPIDTPPTEVPVAEKVDWLGEIDRYARSRDPRITRVMASVVSQDKHVLIAASDGTRVADVQPLVRLNIQVLAADGRRREVGYQGAGGRYELAKLRDPDRWKKLVDEAVRVALLNL
ncbi:MAG TPA: metalloprotease TldD, partial [Deltaproteobacteria bacterium]|nr:metalloprotease TldD [Deltaproteobacteria bacterium]